MRAGILMDASQNGSRQRTDFDTGEEIGGLRDLPRTGATK